MKIKPLVIWMSMGLVSMGTASIGALSTDAASNGALPLRGWSIDALAAEPGTEPTPEPLPSPPVPPVDPVQNPQPVDSAPVEDEDEEGVAMPAPDDDDGFGLWDADSSGSLSKAEVDAGPRRYDFARLDRDGDGKVSVEEWARRGEPDAEEED